MPVHNMGNVLLDFLGTCWNKNKFENYKHFILIKSSRMLLLYSQLIPLTYARCNHLVLQKLNKNIKITFFILYCTINLIIVTYNTTHTLYEDTK